MTNQNSINNAISKMKTGNVFGIFHNDLDGYGCKKVADCFLTLKDASHISYNNVSEKIDSFCTEWYKHYDCLIVADLSLDANNLNKLTKLSDSGYPIMYFDHHYKTDEQMELIKNAKFISVIDNKNCAASIMYNYFISNKFPLKVETINLERLSSIITLIDAWDTYKFQDPKTYEILNEDARDLQIYFKEFGSTKTLEKIDNYITCKFDNIFSNMEISNIRLLKRDIRRSVNDRNKNLDVIQFPFNGEIMDIGITYAEKDISEIGNRLNILNKHLSFIVVIDMVHKSVNFRTIFDKPNLAKVAAMYGGGGHPKSAGCELNEAAFNAFINKNLSRKQVDALLSLNLKKNEVTANKVEETQE